MLKDANECNTNASYNKFQTECAVWAPLMPIYAGKRSQLVCRSPAAPNSANIDQAPCGTAIDWLFAGVRVHAIACGVKLNWVPAG